MIKTMFNGGINGSWDFMVMSAQDAEEFICEPHNRRIAFISITEANGHHIDFHKSYDKIDFLPLKFFCILCKHNHKVPRTIDATIKHSFNHNVYLRLFISVFYKYYNTKRIGRQDLS